MNAPFPTNDNTARDYCHDGIVLTDESPALAKARAEWRRQFEPMDLLAEFAALRPATLLADLRAEKARVEGL